ncbi:MAG: GTP-binding protein [Paracraurococcus sp.]
MSTLNRAKREINCKIVYWGPGLSGKATSMNYIYQTAGEAIKGEFIKPTSGDDQIHHFDYVPLSLGNTRGLSTRLHLYVLPGQTPSTASKISLLKDVDGIVFVADSLVTRVDANLQELDLLRQGLAQNGLDLASTPWVIQYNKRDLPEIAAVADMQGALNPGNVPAFETIATKGISVREALRNLSQRLQVDLRMKY